MTPASAAAIMIFIGQQFLVSVEEEEEEGEGNRAEQHWDLEEEPLCIRSSTDFGGHLPRGI